MGPLQRIGGLFFAGRESQPQADRPNIGIIGASPSRIRRAVRNDVVHVSHADREKAGQQCSGDHYRLRAQPHRVPSHLWVLDGAGFNVAGRDVHVRQHTRLDYRGGISNEQGLGSRIAAKENGGRRFRNRAHAARCLSRAATHPPRFNFREAGQPRQRRIRFC